MSDLAASGPTQSDVHVDRVIGAIHPFTPGPDGMCAKCGKKMHKARDFDPFNYAGNSSADPDMTESHAEDDDPGDALDGTPFPSPPTDFIRPVTDAEYLSENEAPPPEFLPVSPRAPKSAPQKGRAMSTTMSTPSPRSPALFHEPLPELSGQVSPQMSKTASTSRPQRAPRGAEAGEIGEWQTKNPQGTFNPAGQLDQLRQDGPMFGPDNPDTGIGPRTPLDPTTSESSHQGTPSIRNPRQSPVVHHFEQCPQCGTGVDGTEDECPNPWCGHNLANDATSSYDHWQETGGVSKSFLPIHIVR